jgi:hypothetical protein
MKSSAKLSERLKIHLYKEPSSKTLDLEELARYLREKLGQVSVDICPPFFTASSEEAVESLARRLAQAKVRDPLNPDVRFQPLPGEIEFERKLIRNPSLRLSGVLYDGFMLQTLALELLPEGELDLSHIHIIFTNRLFGTWDENDGRYHMRVSVYGFPSLISTTGIVEAPAKPKEFYELKQKYVALGLPVWIEELKEKFRGRFIDYDDERLTEVMKGYVMQALFYHIFGEPFCQEKKCRLFNAHWQEEVLEAQLGEPEFCDRHTKLLQELRLG